LFPGYVFVRVAGSELFDVACIPSVVSIVLADGRPAVIKEQEIDNVRRYAQALSDTGREPEPHPIVAVGQRVMVCDGPFKGVEGVALDHRGARRVVLGIAALGHGFTVSVPSDLLRILDEDE
jgi:transcription antitermination factor NusG